MKWIFWLFNVVMALGLIALFINLIKARNYSTTEFNPPTVAVTPTPLNYPAPVIKTPKDKQAYSGIVGNSVFYPERKPPTPESTPTPTSSGKDVPSPGATPKPAVKQCERLDNVRYVTHFVNWGTPTAHLEVVNPQNGFSSLEKIKLNGEFRNWKVFEITHRRVVLKGIMNNEEVYHMFSPELSPMGQQLNKAGYEKILKADLETKTGGLPTITPSNPDLRSMTPPPPVYTPAPVTTPMEPTKITPPPMTPPPPTRATPQPFPGTRREGADAPRTNPFERTERTRR